MWDLSSLIRDRTHIPCIGRWSLNHWIAREVLELLLNLNEVTCGVIIIHENYAKL